MLFLISIGNCEFGHAQIHDYPKNEARGIPGQEPRSFVFGWRSVEGAQSYEYILTDNPFCFSNFGCPIRAGIVEDTFAIGFGLTEDWSYYWITRVIYQNGDTSAWSNPSSFFAQDPPDRPLITAVPNPSFNGNVQVWLDWSASNDLDRVELDVFDALGNRVTQTANYEFLNSPLRIQPIVLNKEKLPIGMYFVRARPLASDGFVLEDRWIRLVLR
ncbi:MAG: T9SS type A sorting domain-containing protein [Bacteroidia bacterium]|nr:T9SS type A sorting domain-containing protein [Bacteroidia bacterium]